MNVDPEEIRTKLEAGRASIAGRLRLLADEIETLPLEGAAEALSWLGDHIERLLREADRILGAAPAAFRPEPGRPGAEIACQTSPTRVTHRHESGFGPFIWEMLGEAFQS